MEVSPENPLPLSIFVFLLFVKQTFLSVVQVVEFCALIKPVQPQAQPGPMLVPAYVLSLGYNQNLGPVMGLKQDSNPS